MQESGNSNDSKAVLFLTAQDVFRFIQKNPDIEPINFLYAYPKIESLYPSFKLKGKEYLLGLNSTYDSQFRSEGELDFKKRRLEIKKYRKITEIWNRNFGDKGSFSEFLSFIINEVSA